MNRERWCRLMSDWQLRGNTPTFNQLVAAYAEKGRYYHTADHISACLRHLDECRAHLDAIHEVELALWFHDAVYRPLSKSNELDSANWAATFLIELGVDTDVIDRIHRLIMVTEHSGHPQSQDESVLIDIDLSILGTDTATYAAFEADVRREYRMVPGFLYRKRRAQLLEGFLARPRIFASGCFLPEREERARENLSNAIHNLRHG